jgi:hypothetical protein
MFYLIFFIYNSPTKRKGTESNRAKNMISIIPIIISGILGILNDLNSIANRIIIEILNIIFRTF